MRFCLKQKILIKYVTETELMREINRLVVLLPVGCACFAPCMVINRVSMLVLCYKSVQNIFTPLGFVNGTGQVEVKVLLPHKDNTINMVTLKYRLVIQM